MQLPHSYVKLKMCDRLFCLDSGGYIKPYVSGYLSGRLLGTSKILMGLSTQYLLRGHMSTLHLLGGPMST